MEGYNVSTMLKRLEAAASRLEDVVMFAEMRRAVVSEDDQNGNGTTRRNTAHAADSTHSDSAGGSAHSNSFPISPKSSTPLVVVNGPPLPELSADVQASAGYKALSALQSLKIDDFVRQSEAVGEGVGAQAKAFSVAFTEMLKVVALAQTHSKPEANNLMAVLEPMNTAAARVEALRDEYRNERALGNFLATVPAGVGALGWVVIEGKQQASGFVVEMRDGAQFYANRVLKDSKDNKPWVESYIGLLTKLSAIVKDNFTEGLQWNPKGPPATAEALMSRGTGVAPTSASASVDAPGASAGGPPPPPPPPPSVEQLTSEKSPAAPAAPADSGSDMGGVLAELSRGGEGIASGLKKVDKQALKATKPPVSKSTKPKSSASASTADSHSTVKPAKKLVPRVELVESTWHVEDLEDRHDLEIPAGLGQSIQIDNCRECTIKITGKAATFNMSRCNKVGLLVENMVASCDIVNSHNFGLQVTGNLPSLMIDQSSQGSIYLSKDSLDVDIFTSQTTTINVNLPEDEPGAYREVPLGEQIVHNLVNGNVRSTVVKHA